jgi:hypothetical protein
MCVNLCSARDVPAMMCVCVCVSFVSLDSHSLHCCRALDTLRRDLCTFVFCARYVRMCFIYTHAWFTAVTGLEHGVAVPVQWEQCL